MAFKALPIHVINVFVLPLFTLSQEGTVAVVVVVVSVRAREFSQILYFVVNKILIRAMLSCFTKMS